MTTGGMASTASVQTSDHDGVVVAVVTGELDPVSVDAVGTALYDHIGTGAVGLVVELAVTFIGSAGLSMLLELYGKAQHDGVGFAIVASEAAALRPMVACGLNEVLPLAGTVRDAVESIRQER